MKEHEVVDIDEFRNKKYMPKRSTYIEPISEAPEFVTDAVDDSKAKAARKGFYIVPTLIEVPKWDTYPEDK